MVLGKAPRKKVESPAKKAWPGADSKAAKKRRLEGKATNVANERNAAHRVA
jgi:hypothetical protein